MGSRTSVPTTVVSIVVEVRFVCLSTAATVSSGPPAASTVRYFGLMCINQGEDWLGIVSAWASGTPASFGRRAK